MALIIDGVFFQLANSGIARVWRSLLPLLPHQLDMPVVFLDRAGRADRLEGVEVVPFPSYKAKSTAADSALLEQLCQHYRASVFISTYYTTPLRTPSVSLIHDMIPERLGFDLTARDWREKEIAIAHARRHVCVSGNTRADLLEFYPELAPERVTVGYNGVDAAIFQLPSPAAVAAFRQRYGLTKPYFLFVGSRVQHKNYKNASLFFDAAREVPELDFQILCVGGEALTADDRTDPRIVQVKLDDASLAHAYGGAAALIYPSLYEGFGMPVAEAMSCGCPVISTSHGSLEEVAGNASLKVSGYSVPEMADAMRRVLDPALRETMVAAGLRQAARFRWDAMADVIAEAVRAVAAEADAGLHDAFHERWAVLRQLQADVDAAV